MVTYRIRDWDDHFENAESRKVKNARWVAIPNKHDGKGYRRVLKHPRAVEIFCAWCLMVQVASKTQVRGILADKDGPLRPEDLADATGYPADIFKIALQVLSRQEIGWISCDENTSAVRTCRDGIPERPDTSGHAGVEGKGRELKGMEINTLPPAGGGCGAAKHQTPQRMRDEPAPEGAATSPDGEASESHPLKSGDEPPKRGDTSPDGEGSGSTTPAPDGADEQLKSGAGSPRGKSFPPGFLAFWAEWPKHERKKGKSKCARFWKREGLEAIAEHVVAAVRRFKASPGWRRQGGQFIPGPEPWLNDESWEVPSDALASRAEGSPDGDRDSPGFDRRAPTEADLRRALGIGPDDPLPVEHAEEVR